MLLDSLHNPVTPVKECFDILDIEGGGDIVLLGC